MNFCVKRLFNLGFQDFHIISQQTPKGPLVNNYRFTLEPIFRLMMYKKAFVKDQYSTLILSDKIEYHTFWALCLEQVREHLYMGRSISKVNF